MSQSDPANAMTPYRSALTQGAKLSLSGTALAHGMFSPLDALPGIAHAATINFMDESGRAKYPGDFPAPPKKLVQALQQGDTP